MRCLKRNMTEFEYQPYVGTDTDVNADGEHTGEFRRVYDYGKPVRYKGNISVPSGHVNQTFYGDDIRYTHVLVMDNPNVDINEHGRIKWNGHLYDVTSVAPTINSVSIALRRQTESYEDPYVPDGDGE